MKTIDLMPPGQGENPLQLLQRCGGYYKCPTGSDGRPRGPIVGYAGTYNTKAGGEKPYVGFEYANFAMAERHGPVLKHFASKLRTKLVGTTDDLMNRHEYSTGFCGAPEGGKALATVLAHLSGKQYIYPEKKVTALKTETSREKSELIFDRHVPHRGDQWWIVEDVCNNFSTTEKLIRLIESFGAEVAGILCFLNRSLTVGELFTIGGREKAFPVVAVVRQQIPEYEQEDPIVAPFVLANNVVWKPKNEWPKLEAAMAAAN